MSTLASQSSSAGIFGARRLPSAKSEHTPRSSHLSLSPGNEQMMLTGDLPRYHFAGLTSCSIASSCSWSTAEPLRRKSFIGSEYETLTSENRFTSVVQVMTLLTVNLHKNFLLFQSLTSSQKLVMPQNFVWLAFHNMLSKGTFLLLSITAPVSNISRTIFQFTPTPCWLRELQVSAIAESSSSH